ncbi:TLC domain-containing protein 3A isoform X2 [Anthonomus grandis grandis]|uniref:TLC domain-containing protein 3A isoform X2 n=1 Tax=Anthonomus grandis grandis TaxID=2921223 RepID=UPI0021664F0A|nr:TLC domain-containing protein 3A isoform X2 [Anthonomus grandis grandis]
MGDPVQAEKVGISFPLLFLATTSLVVTYFTLKDLEWEDRISNQRGLCLFGSGLLFFPSLFVALKNLLGHTHWGRKLMRARRLKYSDVFDICNKLVSAVQALFCCISGLISVQYSCTRNILRTSHYATESYAWFGAAYFFYDIWSMYKVWSVKKSQAKLDGMANQVILKFMKMVAYISDNFVMIFHHIFIGCFGFLVITYLRGGLGDCFFGYIFLMEASTPFVSLRGILSKMGLKDSKWYIANGLSMLFTFFVFRVAMFPYVINLFAQSIHTDFLTAITKLPKNCKISIALLMFPQLYWFGLMLKGATKILFIKEKPEKVANNNNLRKKVR